MLTATVDDLLTFPRQFCIHALELPPRVGDKVESVFGVVM